MNGSINKNRPPFLNFHHIKVKTLKLKYTLNTCQISEPCRANNPGRIIYKTNTGELSLNYVVLESAAFDNNLTV